MSRPSDVLEARAAAQGSYSTSPGQFFTGSLLLSLLGGAVGALLGVAVTVGYALINDLPTVLSALAVGGGIGTALVVGAAAGIYPAVRAAALTPTEALRAA